MIRITFPALLLGAMSAAAAEPVPVTPDNFSRAESDLYFSGVVASGGFARFDHTRELAPLDDQTVIRLNRDTLYSSAVFDLDAGPVTISLPDADDRFVSLQIIDEDQYTWGVFYEPGEYTLTREDVGTRYVVAAVRILLDPADPADVEAAQALQDALGVDQAAEGAFEVPEWDQASQSAIRRALLDLGSFLPDTRGMFGARGEVDPVRFLIGSAQAWGGNPAEHALYLNVVPERNDGATVYRVTVRDVPVAGFWSISVYDAQGYYQPNEFGAYTLNDRTAETGPDGAVTIQFGGCDGIIPNCLPTTEGWNYMVRLYRPGPEILDGSWHFPVAEVAE